MSASLPPQMEGQVAAPNPLELFWEQHRKAILVVGALVLAGVSAFYLKRHQDAVERNEAASRFQSRTGLDRLITSATPSRRRQFAELDLDLAEVSLTELDSYIADEAKGTAYEPWAIWVAANALLVQGSPDAAEARLNQLKSSFPNHILCARCEYPPQVRPPVEKKEGDKGTGKDKKKKRRDKPSAQEKPELQPPVPGSPVDRLLQTIRDNRSFKEKHQHLFEAQKPDGAVVDILLKNTKVTVQLYKEAAPDHASQFLKLAKEGFYNGQKVYKIQRDPSDSRRQREPQLLHFGVPKTKETDDTREWEKAAEQPSATLLDFPSTDRQKKLSFFPGVLAVENEKEGKTSGERLFLAANDCAGSMDGEFVILGKVVGGLQELQELVRNTGFSSGDEAKAGVGKPADLIEVSVSVR